MRSGIYDGIHMGWMEWGTSVEHQGFRCAMRTKEHESLGWTDGHVGGEITVS